MDKELCDKCEYSAPTDSFIMTCFCKYHNAPIINNEYMPFADYKCDYFKTRTSKSDDVMCKQTVLDIIDDVVDIEDECKYDTSTFNWGAEMRRRVVEAPSEEKTAMWRHHVGKNEWACSNCFATIKDERDKNKNKTPTFKYCPYCGARMINNG